MGSRDVILGDERFVAERERVQVLVKTEKSVWLSCWESTDDGGVRKGWKQVHVLHHLINESSERTAQAP